MPQTVIELDTLLPPETLERLHAAAQRQHLPLPDLVRDAIEAYLNEEVYEDTPDEEILASLRDSFTGVLEGKTRPARDVLAEIRRELAEDDDAS
jgi:predicted DNA-binding protein